MLDMSNVDFFLLLKVFIKVTNVSVTFQGADNAL